MKKGIIFCVDDEKIILNGLKTELKEKFGAGYIIETAENGSDVLDMLDEFILAGYEIPVIISDYAMPGIKGDELLSRVHDKSPNTLKILLTGQATVEGVTNSINQADLYRYIAKPWEANDLILTVEQAIKSYNQKNLLEKQNKELFELSSSLEEKVSLRTEELLQVNLLLIDKQIEISRQNEELEKYHTDLENLVAVRTEELRIAKEKAEESNRLKSAFMENISHEIRTPMNGILGFIDLIKDPEFDESNREEFLGVIESCSRQLMGIITDIVEISKLETNLIKPVIKPCRLDALCEKIIAMHQHKITANPKLIIKAHCFKNELWCLTDEVKLNQVITNLVGNAIKNTPQGAIELRCNLLINEKKILFSVRDTGIGIPKEYHDKIFERFRQVDTYLTRKQGGTGLGLSISKAYVELLGGEIWVESEVGIGSTFYFSIPYSPVVPEADSEIEKLNEKAIHPDLHELTVLVAEDIDTNFKLLELALKKEKINILRACNGEEAVEMCKANKEIDLVLMDIKMPVMGGLDATKIILNYRKDLPIIAQTAYAFSDDRIKALESGCVDYISKPIKMKALIDMIYKYAEIAV